MRLERQGKEVVATIGHIHVKVRDLEEAEAFYTRFLDLKVTERVGNHYSFLTAGKMHHDVALQSVGPNAPLPTRDQVGLFHAAFEVPNKAAFAATYLRLKKAGVPVVVTDQRISWALYFSDPSENGVEVYCDTRAEADGVSVWKGQDRTLDEAKIMKALIPKRTRGF